MIRIDNPEELVEPEQDLRVERRVLAACMFLLDDAQDFLFGWLDPQDFYDPVHGMLMTTLRDKWEQGLLTNGQQFGRWMWKFCKDTYRGFLGGSIDDDGFPAWSGRFLDEVIYGCGEGSYNTADPYVGFVDMDHDAVMLRITYQEDAAILRRLRLRRAEAQILFACYAKVQNAARASGSFSRRIGELLDFLDQLESSSGTLLRHLPPELK